jgi:hypothetical protein
MCLGWIVGAAWQEVTRREQEAARKKKKIDRIAQNAEAAQRRAKGGHWK